MNLDEIRQTLGLHLSITYGASFAALFFYKAILEQRWLQNRLAEVRLAMGFVFLLSYLYGLNVVLEANSKMEDVISAVISNNPRPEDKLWTKCQAAFYNDIINKEKNDLSALSPCITLGSSIAREQKHLAEGKASLPSSMMTILIAFLSAFQGGLCATFLYAWATTVRTPFYTHD